MSTDTLMIKKLVELRMNERESRLYLALLHTTEATPAQLHRISGVPRTKTYETLERMVAAGFCRERQEGRRKFFRATRPSAVFEMLGQDWERKHRARLEMAEDVFGELDLLFLKSSAQDPGLDHIEVIRSQEQINITFLGLMSKAESEVLSFSRSPYAAANEVTRVAVKQAQYEAFARGVRVKTVYMVEEKEEAWLRDFIVDLEQAGEEVRLADDLPMKMFLFDRKHALIALPSVPDLAGAEFTMLAVEDAGFIRACTDLFETHWDRARTAADYLDGTPG